MMDIKNPDHPLFRAYGVLTDDQISHLCHETQMIFPFIGRQMRRDHQDKGLVSYGLTSYGYDARLGTSFKIFTNVNSAMIDPKAFDSKAFIQHTGDYCIIPPNSFILGATVERFKIPDDVVCICIGKSTYARCGLIVNVTPLEPGWEGHVTVEISNTTPLPAKVYANEGIMQVMFIRSFSSPRVNYRSKEGKYQNQPPIPIDPTIKEHFIHELDPRFAGQIKEREAEEAGTNRDVPLGTGDVGDC